MKLLFNRKNKNNSDCDIENTNDELIDEPLSFDNRVEQNTLSVIKEEGKQERKTKSLSYSFGILKFLVIIVVILAAFDALEHKYNIDNPLLQEVFELLKYATTTVMGYLFARKEEE